MRVLVDMNLSPEWVHVLGAFGIEATHWSYVGVCSADDAELFRYARERRFVLLTQDLDFNEILFETGCDGPSTVLLRVGDELDEVIRGRVASAIQQHLQELEAGALLVVKADRVRIRSLPLGP